MIRGTRWLLWLIFSPVIILFAAPIFLLFGRTPAQEMVVDAALDDDPGESVDLGGEA